MANLKSLLMLFVLFVTGLASSQGSTPVINGAAILTIPDGNLGTHDVATAVACDTLCVSVTQCSGWSFTNVTRRGACPKNGCCFLKSGDQATIQNYMRHCSDFVTGCVGFNCTLDKGAGSCTSPSPPSPPSPPQPTPPFAFATPNFTASHRVIANVNGTGTLRDPTTIVYDPVTRTWNVFCTFVKGALGVGGYHGVIRRFYTLTDPLAHAQNGVSFDSSDSAWSDGGIVLNATGEAIGFDGYGVFTPGIVRDCVPPSSTNCTWLLFFGGVPINDKSHAESIGVALSHGVGGPYQRYEHNPVFSRLDSIASWCGDGPAARVDEIKSSVVQGSKVILVKCVCNNFTALPIVYSPQNQQSWLPPYVEVPAVSPLFQASETCGRKGFEEPTLFKGPDDFLHFIAHNHGSCPSGKYSHFISRNSSITEWVQAPHFGNNNFEEPVPIPLSQDGVFGANVSTLWVDFAVMGWDKIVLTNVTWTWNTD
eukprot:m.257183 g.257183  ORF g.257183 m.257183 type:complete len:480 (+) comp35043_c0_seq1:107-1546(+)